jgi:O-antigen ligase
MFSIAGPLLLGFTLQWVDFGPLPAAQAVFFLPALLMIPQILSGKLPKPPNFYIVYFLFLLVLTLMLPFSGDLGAGFTAVARGVAYSTLAYFTYAWLIQEDPEVRSRELSSAIYWVAPGFFAFFYLSSLTSGVNLIEALVHAVSTGNPYVLQYRMFNLVLNDGAADGGLSSAARHGIVISLLTCVYLHLILRDRKSLLGTALCVAVILFALLSLSRSALLGAFLGLICYSFYRLAQQTFPWVKVMFAAVVGLLVFLMNEGGGGLSQVLQEKFVSDVSDNPRVHEFSQTLGRINERVLFGWGTGTHQNLTGLDAQYPHNFVLYGWQQAGMLGFGLTFAFLALVVHFIGFTTSRAMRFSRTDRTAARLFILSAMLMCFVLTRLLFAKAGLLAVPEWVALSLACFATKRALQVSAWADRAPDRAVVAPS